MSHSRGTQEGGRGHLPGAHQKRGGVTSQGQSIKGEGSPPRGTQEGVTSQGYPRRGDLPGAPKKGGGVTSQTTPEGGRGHLPGALKKGGGVTSQGQPRRGRGLLPGARQERGGAPASNSPDNQGRSRD